MIAGAAAAARVQRSAKVMTSHLRCLRPITSTPFEITSPSDFKSNILESIVVIWPSRRGQCVSRTGRDGPIVSMGPGTDPAGQGRTPPDAGPAPSASIANTLSGAVPLNFSSVASGETRLERVEERGKPGRPGQPKALPGISERLAMSGYAARIRPAEAGASLLGARASSPRAHSWKGSAPDDFTPLAVRQAAAAVPWRGGLAGVNRSRAGSPRSREGHDPALQSACPVAPESVLGDPGGVHNNR